MELLVATHNRGKIAEFAEMLADLQIDWLSLDDIGVTADVAETGHTFRENAVLKAEWYAQETGLLTLADDSGLEVDALNGKPGVFTARYGGPGLTHENRYQLLLKNLRDVPELKRTARFRCVIALVGGDGLLLDTSNGICEGSITFAPAGDGGFGYDPVFYLPERGQTMAQVGSKMKHRISHRGRAMKAMEPRLRQVLGQF